MPDLVQEYRQGIGTVAGYRPVRVGLEVELVLNGICRQRHGQVGSGAVAILSGLQLQSGIGDIDGLSAKSAAGRIKDVRPALRQHIAAEQAVIDYDAEIEGDVRGGQIPGPDCRRGVERIQN